MTDPLFPTDDVRELFLAQLDDIARGRDLDLHVCDRLTDADEAHLREQVRVIRRLVVELRHVWALDQVLNQPDAHERVEREMAAQGQAEVPPIAGKP